MTASQPVILQVKRRFDASPERVFDAWLDPETAGKWLFRSEEGEAVTGRVDARVGGSFAFVSHQVGGFLGVWLGGYLYEVYGSYDVVWWLGVALGLFAAVVHWPIREAPVERGVLAPA